MASPEGILAKVVETAPHLPGCYVMRGKGGEVLYVGKAKDLRARLRAYLGADSRPMVPFLLSKVQDVELVVTVTEKEALILENSLIKEHRPRYNVDFRDDKAFFHLRVDLREAFPRLSLIRRPMKDGARYFGPYPSSAAARKTLDFLQGVFQLRNCRERANFKRTRPCLEFEIGRCSAPCSGFISSDEYLRAVEDAVSFLEGRGTDLIKSIEKRMHEAAEQERFEVAAILRDRIKDLAAVREKQRVVFSAALDQDVFGIARQGDATQVCVLRIREGRLVGQDSLPLIHLDLTLQEILAAVIQRRYDGPIPVPAEIVLPEKVDNEALLAEWLGDKVGKTVLIKVPKRGRGRELVEMACRNACNILRTRLSPRKDPEEILRETASLFSLPRLPRRIECFDVSNTGGRQAVGSRVCFVDGVPRKRLYRRYRICTVPGANDYAMIIEVLRRRFTSPEEPPDLVVIDGGKGHLAAALTLLGDLGVVGPAVIAIAKDRHRERKGETEGERVYLPGRRDAIRLVRRPVVMHFLQFIRDEAHRFAVAYHRRVREREDLACRLDAVRGVGKLRRKALLEMFRSVDEIGRASPEEIAKIGGISRQTAQRLILSIREGGGR